MAIKSCQVFVRSGDVYGDGYIGWSGLFGFHWSNRASIDTPRSFYFDFTESEVIVFNDYITRNYPFPLRCLVR